MKLRRITSGTIVALFLASILLMNFNILPVKAEPMELVIASDADVEWSSDGTSWNPAVACWIFSSWPSIPDATWIWRTENTNPFEEYETVPDGGWYFRKGFNIPDNAYSITGILSITADNAYELFINGNFIGGDGAMTKDGSEPTSVWESIETYSISNELHAGENTIGVRALNHGNWGAYPDLPENNPAGLIFKATITFTLPGPMLNFSDILAIFSLGIVNGLLDLIACIASSFPSRISCPVFSSDFRVIIRLLIWIAKYTRKFFGFQI